MRVQRGRSSDGRRAYTTVHFNGQDLLAALVEYVSNHGHVLEDELSGFKLHWNISLRYVSGHGLENFLFLKIAREIPNDQPDEAEAEAEA